MAGTPQDTIEELADNFALFDEWEDKYAYIVDLGRRMDALPDAEKSPETKVTGCMSQVWIKPEVTDDVPARLRFRGDSDAHIVKGLIAILLQIYSDRTAEEILSVDPKAMMTRLELENHISPNRRNGLVSMVETIRGYASRLKAKQEA
ncbi:MAG: SufE family protein [Caenispirillum bisanense]|nr:SufE family protein [Caenispirillum bisanense]MCA1975300.1 SufE family protein [Caenispirillum sp.]